MSPIGSRHAASVSQLNGLLVTFFGQKATINVQNPFVLGGRSEPQPDLTVVRSRADRYKTALAMPPDVMLLIEVSDTTLNYDRNTKLPLYAGAGIPEVWIVNIGGETIEIYTQPTGGAYAPPQIVKRGESFTSPTIPGPALTADDILL
ncbi:MAG: Uma2 family endonuclease [Chloroflexia bacterium]